MSSSAKFPEASIDQTILEDARAAGLDANYHKNQLAHFAQLRAERMSQGAPVAGNVPEVYVITRTNYWKNKNGTTSVVATALCLQSGMQYLDNLKKDEPDYNKSKWLVKNGAAEKSVDYDGAYVTYKVEPIPAAPTQPTTELASQVPASDKTEKEGKVF